MIAVQKIMIVLRSYYTIAIHKNKIFMELPFQFNIEICTQIYIACYNSICADLWWYDINAGFNH